MLQQLQVEASPPRPLLAPPYEVDVKSLLEGDTPEKETQRLALLDRAHSKQVRSINIQW